MDEQKKYKSVTNDIGVSVVPFYLDQESDPEEGHYVWGYQVHIENYGRETVQLHRRHWIITDGNGQQHEVDGEGVVGEKEIHETGAGDLRAFDLAGARQAIDDFLRQFPRRFAGGFCKHHGQVGGVVAVLHRAGPLELRADVDFGGDHAIPFQVQHGLRQQCFDVVFEHVVVVRCAWGEAQARYCKPLPPARVRTAAAPQG